MNKNSAWEIKDKVVLITGATSGIGKAAAMELARLGAKVIVHGRDKTRTENTVREIIKATGNKSTGMILCDLSSLANVKKMADVFKSKYNALHVLINNAGAVFLDREVSRDGFEMTFAVNYLSHFLLTNLLLPLLKKSAPSRIIHVSSSSHKIIHHIDLEKIPESAGPLLTAYSASKVCVNLFAFDLAERLKSFNITSNAVHPGVVHTGFGMNIKNKFLKFILSLFMTFVISPEKGARTSIRLASSPELEGVTGKYFAHSKEVPPSKLSNNKELQKKLREMSVRLVKDYL